MEVKTTRKGAAPRLLKGWGFWAVLRTAALAAFFLLIAAGAGRRDIAGLDVPDPLMYTNLAGVGFWVLWMMGLVLLVPLLGRAWCGACPVGAVNEWVSRWGRKLHFPTIFRNEALKTVALVGTLLLLGIARIHHYPSATAWYLVAWLAAAVLLGLLFAGRSVCAHLCPVGGMLAQYGRCAPLEVTVRDRSVCADCRGRECVRGAAGTLTAAVGRLRAAIRVRRHPCPVNLKVWDMGGSERCLMCFNCMRVCPLDNVVLSPRPPVASLWRESYPRASGMVLTAALAGFLLVSFARFWPALSALLAWPLSAAGGLMGVTLPRWLFILWLGLLLPLLLLYVPALVHRWSSAAGSESADRDGDGRFLKVWLEGRVSGHVAGNGEEKVLDTGTVPGLMAAFAPSLVPLLLAGHMVLALVKINAKAAYLPLALWDPAGIRTYLAIEEIGTLARPGLLVPVSWVRWAAAVLVAAGVVVSSVSLVRIGRRQGRPFTAFFVPLAALSLVVAGGLYKWLF